MVCLRETGGEFQDDEKAEIDDIGPFAAVSISCQAKGDGTHGSHHQHESDAPRNGGGVHVKGLGKAGDREGHGEVVKGIPGPAEERDEEKQPLLDAEETEQRERVRKFLAPLRLQMWNACGEVFARGEVEITRTPITLDAVAENRFTFGIHLGGSNG